MRAPAPTAVAGHGRPSPSPQGRTVAALSDPASGRLAAQGRALVAAAGASTTGTTVGAGAVLPRRDGSQFSER